ncbi:hypothetical protein L7F22_018989 [Adiantum nelumboides]|nr:hypothetical protein [Adiantum nelumboides]
MSTSLSQPEQTSTPSTTPAQGGVVRSCLSGDTLIIRPRGVVTPGAERTLHIAGIAAPRMGTRERDDEPFAFLSREFLRKLLVGREIRYRVEYTVPISAQNAVIREYVHVFLPPESPGASDVNVSHKILAAGWARVHDSVSRRNANAVPEEEEDGGYKSIQRSVQEEAQKDSVGVWGPNDLLKVEHNMTDSTSFLAEWKGKEIESVVEQVRDGSMLRVRLFLSSNHHQIINLSLAGVKAPRLAGAGGPSNHEGSEPFAEEARFFVESRLLQRNVRVTLLSLPPSAAPTPFSVSGNAPAPQSTFSSSILIGQMMHPVGDIAQFLLASGLAKCVDWHAGMVAMDKYRLAEKAAKDKRLNIWRDYQPPAKSADTVLPASPAARTFEANVVRVISGDTIHVRKVNGEGQAKAATVSSTSNAITSGEQRIHLSSIRQPVLKDEKQAGYANEAKDLLRKRLVGKPVMVRIDYIKKEVGSDDRSFATVTATTGSKETRDVGETLISRGLATVMRHRNGDEDRSPDWDKLMAIEAEASGAQRGLHSGKELTVPKYVDASESAGKANAYLSTLKRLAKVNAIVDFCASASRFKLIVPRENCKLTFVLAGVRAPRIGRTPSDHDEPFSREGLEWSTEKVLQRDVDIEVFSIDKAGGFIGAMLINNRSENVAVKLVEQGLANVHHYSAESLPFGQQLIDAELRAKSAKVGMWINHVEEDDEQGDHAFGESVGSVEQHTSSTWANKSSNGALANGASTGKAGWGQKAPLGAVQNGTVTPKTEYVDITVSDVRGDGGASVPFSFSVQILNDRIKELEKLMQELSTSQKAATKSFASAGQQRVGDWVIARFSGDGQWYRGQILRNKPAQKAKEILFVDYGNVEDVNTNDIRALDDVQFGKRRLPAQCHPARLSFVKLYEGRSVADTTSKQQKSVGGRQPQPVQAQVGTSDEYALDAIERFKDVTEGQKLIANIDHRDTNGTLHLTLYDPNNASAIAQGRPEACINVDLCAEGFALPDKRVPYWPAYSQMTKAVENANQEARRRHLGVFELGDPTGDE